MISRGKSTEYKKNNSKILTPRARIMLVDDEPDINTALEVVLTRAGFGVDTFEDPLIALEKTRRTSYDLIILDVKMPNMDGFDLYQEIRKNNEKVKICFITASELFYERLRQKKYMHLDKSLFIRKPVSNADLIQRIDSWLNVNETSEG